MPNANAPRYAGPLITSAVHGALLRAAHEGAHAVECSLDLQRTSSVVTVSADWWSWNGGSYPYLQTCKDRTIYFWDGTEFQSASRYAGSLIKLVPTTWGAPTFEIDGIKMLPTEHVSPYEDARRKVQLIGPRGKRILDTCGGLGYFASWCLEQGARYVHSYEKNPDVIWLRMLNPWSPPEDSQLELQQADVAELIDTLPPASYDAILHDPPRFGIAGELYSQRFYDSLARVLKAGGKLFHYTGSPNKLTSGRDVPSEVATRLRRSGFTTRMAGDGVLAVNARSGRP